MHRTGLTLALAALLLAPAAAAGTVLAFQAPGQLDGDAQARGLDRVLLVFRDGADAAYAVPGGTYTNHTMLGYASQGSVDSYQPEQDQRQPSPLGSTREALSFAPGWGSLYVAAKRINLTVERATGRLEAQEADTHLATLLPAGSPHGTYRGGWQAGTRGAALALAGQPGESFRFTLQAEGLQDVEWHHARADCGGASPCPDGGSTGNVGVPLPDGGDAAVLREFYSEVTAADGSLHAQGLGFVAISGGPAVDLTVARGGHLRLPLATLAAPCGGCEDPGGRTTAFNGTVNATGLAYRSPTQLVASVDGKPAAARLDEVAVDPARLLGAAPAAVVAAGVAAIGVAWLLFWALFSRHLTPEDALKHPARRLVYAAVERNPGSTYRELMALTGLSDGGVRNHLRTLTRVGLLVVQEHGAAVIYFENHGRYAATWKSVAALREEGLRGLIAFLRDNPGRSQQDIVEHAEGLGLTRRATQRRLGRLAAWGLVQVERDGHAKRYRLAPAFRLD